MANQNVNQLFLFGDSHNISVLGGAAGVRFPLILVALQELDLGPFIKAAS